MTMPDDASNSFENALVVSGESALVPETTAVKFGEYVRKSRICPICKRDDHMEINRMRAVECLPIRDIATAKGTTPDALETHFRNHFIIAKHNQDILDLQESSGQEPNEIITRAIEGEIDLFGGALAVTKAKAQRLHGINERIKYLADQREVRDLDVEEKQEYMMLCKLAEDVENSIIKTQQFVHKKVFPSSKEELAKQVTSYKLSVLSKFVDDVIMVLLEFEKNPEYSNLIKQIRISLSQRVSSLEARILKSGGVLRSIDEDET